MKKSKKSVSEQVTLEFADNKLLAALGGPHEKNFARLEQRLNIHVTQRGNRVAITGADRHRGATILSALYARLQAGESVALAEVDSELRFADSARAQTPGASRSDLRHWTRSSSSSALPSMPSATPLRRRSRRRNNHHVR